MTEVDVTDWTFEYTSAGPLYSETHGGDDVAIFASGPGAFLFHTSHEQTHIFQVMAYSLCVGDYMGYAIDDSICQMSKCAYICVSRNRP